MIVFGLDWTVYINWILNGVRWAYCEVQETNIPTFVLSKLSTSIFDLHRASS